MKVNLQEKIEIRELGAGGFGTTKLFKDRDNHRFVLKTFQPKGSNDSPKALALFKAECDRLNEVGDHPQIPSYLGFDEADGKYSIAQQYIPGDSLRKVLNEQGSYSPEQAVSLLEQLLIPLRHLHANSIIHRDIKPDNIIVRSSDQLPCIVDFGAAKVVSETILAQTGTMIGTANYAAPEQMAGKTCFQSDIYSLGLTMIEMLTGQNPFEMLDYSTGEWTWSESIPDIDPRIEKILMMMTQRNLRDRYSNIDQIDREIKDYYRYSLEESERIRICKEKEARQDRLQQAKRLARRKFIVRRVIPSVLLGGIAISGGVAAWQKFDIGDRLSNVVVSMNQGDETEQGSKNTESVIDDKAFMDLVWFSVRGLMGVSLLLAMGNVIIRIHQG